MSGSSSTMCNSGFFRSGKTVPRRIYDGAILPIRGFVPMAEMSGFPSPVLGNTLQERFLEERRRIARLQLGRRARETKPATVQHRHAVADFFHVGEGV